MRQVWAGPPLTEHRLRTREAQTRDRKTGARFARYGSRYESQARVAAPPPRGGGAGTKRAAISS
jgi:hypothetical protein